MKYAPQPFCLKRSVKMLPKCTSKVQKHVFGEGSWLLVGIWGYLRAPRGSPALGRLLGLLWSSGGGGTLGGAALWGEPWTAFGATLGCHWGVLGGLWGDCGRLRAPSRDPTRRRKRRRIDARINKDSDTPFDGFGFRFWITIGVKMKPISAPRETPKGEKDSMPRMLNFLNQNHDLIGSGPVVLGGKLEPRWGEESFKSRCRGAWDPSGAPGGSKVGCMYIAGLDLDALGAQHMHTRPSKYSKHQNGI